MDFNLKRVLKALLFSTSDSLSIKDIQTVITRFHQQSESRPEGDESPEIVSPTDESGQHLMADLMEQVPTMLTATQIRDAIDAIRQELIDGREVFRLIEGPHGYRFAINPDYSEWVRLMRDEPKPQKLSPAAMEVLAIIAYRQPVTRAELEAIRGVSSDSGLNRLMERELIYVTGRAELPGRPLQYATTDKFLEFCGLSSIEELPASDVLSPNQLSEWIRRATTMREEISDADVGLPDS